MKYCSKCGTQLMDDDIICHGCGCRTGKDVILRITSDKVGSSEAKTQRKATQPNPESATEYYVPKDDPIPTKPTSERAKPKSTPIQYKLKHINKANNGEIKADASTKYVATFLGILSIVISVVSLFLSCDFIGVALAGAAASIIMGIIVIVCNRRDPKPYIGIGIGLLACAIALVQTRIFK